MLTRRQLAEQLVRTPRKLDPLNELVNSLEFAEQAARVLPEDVFATIAGSDRSIFDRYTFRPRMNVPTLDMDLSVELLGESLFTPIVVGPIANQTRYHAEGERATVAGAAAAKTRTILSQHETLSVSKLAAESEHPVWLAVDADENGAAHARASVAAGAAAIFVTVHDDWSHVGAIRKSVDVPMVLQGVLSEEGARRAIGDGYDALIVSKHGRETAPIPELHAIADAIGNEVPILVNGNFRRATDIMVALILGARAVLVARPIIWALAAYGSDGVTTLLKMLQLDVARCFAMLGASNVGALTTSHLRIHRR